MLAFALCPLESDIGSIRRTARKHRRVCCADAAGRRTVALVGDESEDFPQPIKASPSTRPSESELNNFLKKYFGIFSLLFLPKQCKAYLSTVKQTLHAASRLSNLGLCVNGGRKVRRGHWDDMALEKCVTSLVEKGACTPTWNNGVRFDAEC